MSTPHDDELYSEVFDGSYLAILEQHPEVSADAAATAAATLMLVARARAIERELWLLNEGPSTVRPEFR